MIVSWEFEVEISKITKSEKGCFIATATMGDYNHPIVTDLRLFRDNWLLKRSWGRYFTILYYQFSPTIARLIDKSIILKKNIILFSC